MRLSQQEPDLRRAARRAGEPTGPAWRQLRPAEVDAWNRPAHAAGAHLWQLPFWRGFLDRRGLRAQYFVDDRGGEATAWACVMRSGPPGYRFALVQDGPVSLSDPAGPVPEESVRRLCATLRSLGYVFVRFSNSAQQLTTVSAQPGAVGADFFPFFCRDASELHVTLADDEQKTLASFQWRARNAIKKATKAGYQVHSGRSDELLEQAHDLVLKTAVRKGFRVPSRETLEALYRESAAVDGVRFYVARRGDEDPVGAVVVGTDRSTWHYLFGGVDADRVSGEASPITLLHWTAMRDATREHAGFYNLGASMPVSIGQFKQRFRPVETAPPAAVTVPLRPVAVAAWRSVALPTFQTLWPAVQRARYRLWRRHQPSGSEAAPAATAADSGDRPTDG
jgi:GNAT acetyltransferase-like protein